MGTFGTPSSYNNTGALGSANNPTTAQGLSRDRENQKAILELPGTQAWVEKTITDGVIIPTSAEVIVLPEGGASTDSLTTIALTSDGATTLHDGMLIRLKAANSNTITAVHGTGTNNISTIDGNNVVLDTTWYLELKLINGLWVQQETSAYKIANEAKITALARTAPATTTARGIGRVATSADLVDGATITNGPAFLAAGQDVAQAAANFWVGARYAACSTAAATAAKAADLANFQLVKGSRVFVTFTNANTVADALTLNINGTGAKAIYNEFGAVSSSNPMNISAGIATEFIYDGTNWTYQASGGAYDYIGNAFRKLQSGTVTLATLNTQNGTGVGSWIYISAGSPQTLPSGGTWFYWVFGSNNGGTLNGGGNAMGVVAGGSTVPCPTNAIFGFAIRIA